MDWTKVIVEPIGLAGYALALVFALLRKRRGMPRWWPAAAIGLAGVCVVGGLGLAYQKQAVTPGGNDKSARAGEGGTAVNVAGSSNRIGTNLSPAPAALPATPAAAITQQRQDAQAGNDGVAINIQGSGNQVALPQRK